MYRTRERALEVLEDIESLLCGNTMKSGLVKNVEKYYDILCFIVSRLKEASDCKDRVEASMNKIGSECYDILHELKESLEENTND